MGFAEFSYSGSTTTWDWPAGVTSCTVEAVGGAGGGGHAAGNPVYCGGGKGGAFCRATVSKGAETSLTVYVGAGGHSGLTANITNGEASYIQQGASVVARAPGGNTCAQDSGTGATTANGAFVGTETIRNAGGNGGNFSGTSSGGGGGAAGPSGVGGNGSGTTGGSPGGGNWGDGAANSASGANGVAVRNPGVIGNSYGGAGSGGSTNQNTDRTGGNGADGYIVISWVDVATNVVMMVMSNI